MNIIIRPGLCWSSVWACYRYHPHRVHAVTRPECMRQHVCRSSAWGHLRCACSASSPDGQPAHFTLCQMLFYVSAIVTHCSSRPTHPTHPTACELVSIGKREKKRRQGLVALVAQQVPAPTSSSGEKRKQETSEREVGLVGALTENTCNTYGTHGER